MLSYVWAFAMAWCCMSPGMQANSGPLFQHDQLMDHGRQAYVTLLYGDDFLLGVRVLGQSLKDSDTDRDMVVVVAGDISQYALDTLRKDGWIVKTVETVLNPNMRDDGQYPARFWAVYTKLHVFDLVDYEKIIFLDADTIVVKNMDEAFSCPGFCATLRHSERFNSGVMVITPSHELFEDIISKISDLSSYTGGDQGFLNAYFKGFIDSRIFDPAREVYGNSTDATMLLPTRYNADIGLYVANSNRWLLDGPLKVVHYTLGSFKPWDWWCGWLIEEQSRWNQYRMKLGEDSRGRRHGLSGSQAFAQSYMLLFPPMILMIAVRCMLRSWPSFISPFVNAAPFHIPSAWLSISSIVAGYCSIGASVLLSVAIIPSAVTPSWGWILVYEFSLSFFFLIYSKYLHIVWLSGRAGSGLPISKDHRLPPVLWTGTLTYGGVLATLFIGTPFVSSIFRITGFVSKILGTVFGALVGSTIVTHVFVAMAELWFHHK